METDCQKVYNNLTMLLQDICQFLSSDKMGFLSHRDKTLVESLITRAKVQLQEISKIEKLSVAEEYVDMDAKKGPTDEEDEKKLEIYCSADDVHKYPGNVFKESGSYIGDVNKNPGNIIQVSCPYIDVPARNASQNVKYGFLSMKKKFLLFEKLRRVYAAIHNHWLLIYYTEKDNKPHCTFYLKHYEAKENEGPKSTSFELISTFDRKTYFFTALTPKDMLQWVVNINRCHDKVIVQGKELDLDDSVSLEEDDGEHYDIITPGTEHPNADMEDEDDIYLELDELVKPSQNNNRAPQKATEDNTGPPLPGRPQRGTFLQASMPVKALTPAYGSDSSLASYDDISDLVKQRDQNVDGPSSEDNGDETYDIFVNVKQKITKMSTALPISNDRPEDTQSISTKDTIKLYQSKSLTTQTNTTALKEEFRNKSHSFIQEITKKSPSLLKPIKACKEYRSQSSESTEFEYVASDMMKQSDDLASEDDTYDMFVNVKQKITKMSTTLSKNNKDNAESSRTLLNSVPLQSKTEIDDGLKNKTQSIIHELTKKSPLKLSVDPELTTGRIMNKEYNSPTSEPKELKYDVNNVSDQNLEKASSEDEGDETYMFVNVKQKITKMSTALPKINKEHEVRPDEKITTREDAESMSIKDKIGIYQLNSPTIHKNVMEIEEGFRNKSNYPLQAPIDPDYITNKGQKSPEPKDFKYGANDMNKSPASASKKFKVDNEMGDNESINLDSNDFETDSNAADKAGCKLLTSDPKAGKWPGGLHPPVIKKVPAIPLKPKIRDKPFIGKRPLYGFRQVTDDR